MVGGRSYSEEDREEDLPGDVEEEEGGIFWKKTMMMS